MEEEDTRSMSGSGSGNSMSSDCDDRPEQSNESVNTAEVRQLLNLTLNIRLYYR